MWCVLGVDSGGTKTEALLATETGQALGWGQVRASDGGGDGASHDFGRGRSREVVLEAAHRALGRHPYDRLCVVTTGGHGMHFIAKSARGPAETRKMGEEAAAFALAGASAGVVALAGTGAFAHGADAEGRHMHLDGLGPLLGDHGGAYAIGLMAVRAAAQATWHPRHATVLEERVEAALGVTKGGGYLDGLVGFMVRRHDRSQIAALARLVNAAAQEGDRVARDILRRASQDLGETVRDVVDRMGLAGAELPFIGFGGVIVGSELYWRDLCDYIRAFAPRLQPRRLSDPPVLGAVLHALHRWGGAEMEAVRPVLMASARALMEGRT